MSKKTSLTILIILAFVVMGIFSAVLASKQLERPQAKELAYLKANTVSPFLIVTAKGITFGVILIASGGIGALVAAIITKRL